MQLGLNVETGEVGAIWPWAPPCFANSSLSLYADSITAFSEGLPYDVDEEGYPDKNSLFSIGEIITIVDSASKKVYACPQKVVSILPFDKNR